MKLIDQVGRVINLEQTPKRIVSLVPSQTELLCDLGLEEQIVGITKFCIHPEHLTKTKTIVGGTKTIHIQRIKDLAPDIILCNKEENTQEIVRECEAICHVHVTDVGTMEDNYECIKQYGSLFNKEKEAHAIIESTKDAIQSLGKQSMHSEKTPKVAYFIWKNPYMVAGGDTYINHMLNLVGFENAFQNMNRYPEIRMDDLPADLDYVFLSSEPFPFKEKHKDTFLEVLDYKNIVIVDGESFSWYGTRLLKTIEYLSNLRKKLY